MSLECNKRQRRLVLRVKKLVINLLIIIEIITGWPAHAALTEFSMIEIELYFMTFLDLEISHESFLVIFV